MYPRRRRFVRIASAVESSRTYLMARSIDCTTGSDESTDTQKPSSVRANTSTPSGLVRLSVAFGLPASPTNSYEPESVSNVSVPCSGICADVDVMRMLVCWTSGTSGPAAGIWSRSSQSCT